MSSTDSLFKNQPGSSEICYARPDQHSKDSYTGRSRWNNLPVADFGVPNSDLGEEVKAVVQPMPGIPPGPYLAEELIFFCNQSLSRQKVPRSINFEDELPRLPTGKLYKRLLRDHYWGNKTSRIL